MNLDLLAVNGDILLVSQFTLFASTKKGNRPSYIKAAKPDTAIPLYTKFIIQLEKEPGRRNHCQIPERTRRNGLQVPVHHPGWLPCTELLDVQSGPRLRPQPDVGIRRTARDGIRCSRKRLHSSQAPA